MKMTEDFNKEKGFDYIAIGHIHKRDEYYSGSLISLGFDEPGEHGFIYGEVNENKLVRKYLKYYSKYHLLLIDINMILFKDFKRELCQNKKIK